MLAGKDVQSSNPSGGRKIAIGSAVVPYSCILKTSKDGDLTCLG